MVVGKARPDSTHTTIRSSASGKAARSRPCRNCLRLATYSAGTNHPIPATKTTNSSPMIRETLGIIGNSSNAIPINNSGNIKRTAQYICTADEERYPACINRVWVTDV
ncbi:hypothetical protein D3C78_1433290 [compost metagenome]